MKTNQTTRKRLTGGIVAVILLTLCLVVTTYALICYTVYVPNNIFHTGQVDIEIYGDAKNKLIIGEDEFLFEPGMRVNKPFHVVNKTQWDSYCRLYFDKVDGGLADVLQITIRDAAQNVLYTGTMRQLSAVNKGNAKTFVLKANQTNDFTMQFYFPEAIGNEAQDLNLQFALCADATQMKNNDGQQFNDYEETDHFNDSDHTPHTKTNP